MGRGFSIFVKEEAKVLDICGPWPPLALTSIGTTFPARCPGQGDNRKRGQRMDDFLSEIAWEGGGKLFTS